MCIQKITLINFKTYKDPTVFDNLSSRINIIVGKNGSGKSSFLDAIMFALGMDIYRHLGSPARRRLLYDNDKSGSVELVFDTERVISKLYGKVVSSVKREISLRDDQFFVNGKRVQKVFIIKELIPVLGFPAVGRGHQYVRQGLIINMASASDAEHFKLLCNVAGISNKEDMESDSKELTDRFKAASLGSSKIKKKITTWREQKKQHKEATDLAENQQTLECILSMRNYEKAKKKMTKLEAEKGRLEAIMLSHKLELRGAWEVEREASRRLKDYEVLLETTDKESEILHEEFSVAENELRDVVKLTDRTPFSRRLKEDTERKLDSLNTTIRQTRDQLKEKNSAIEVIKQEENEVSLNVAVMERTTTELLDKHKRLEMFTAKDRRDDAISTQVKSLEEHIRDILDKKGKIQEDLQKYAEEIEALTAGSEDLMAMDRLRDSFVESSQELLEIKMQKDQQECKTRDLRKTMYKLECRLSSLQEKLNLVDVEFCKLVGKDVFEGQESVQIVLDLWKRRGGEMAHLAATSYRGMVIDSFNCDCQFYVPICVAAGKKLFLHIVDSIEVADEIMAEVRRMNLSGQIKFLYLDSIRPVDQTVPEAQDAFLLTSKLEYPPEYEEALQDVFGKTLICPSYRASSMLVKFGFNCVTMEGQQISTKGLVMTGECISCSPTILDIQYLRRSLKDEIGCVRGEIVRAFEEITPEQEILDNLIAEVDTLEGKFFEAQTSSDLLKRETISRSQDVRETIRSVESKKNIKNMELASCDMDIVESRTAIKLLEAELHEELSFDSLEKNEEELNASRMERFKLNETLELIRQRVIQLKEDKDSVTTELESSLRIRDGLNSDLLQIVVTEEVLRQKNYELAVVSQKKEDTKKALDEVKESLRTAREKLETEQGVLNRCKTEAKVTQERLKEVMTELTILGEKHSDQERLVKNIARKLSKSHLESSKFKEYRSWRSKRLLEERKKLGSERMAPVRNENVASGLKKSSLERRELTKIRRQMKEIVLTSQSASDETKEAIRQLLQTAFQKLRHQFSEKFRTLVSGGTADVILKTADGEERTSAAGLDYDDCVGLAFHVVFDEECLGEMCEFSDGQQTIIAMALIFALNECSPVPFILLDEVDQSLKATSYADAVYDLINQLSEKTQFIAASFEPEILKYAARIYGFEMRNRRTHAERVDETTALTYLRRCADASCQ